MKTEGQGRENNTCVMQKQTCGVVQVEAYRAETPARNVLAKRGNGHRSGKEQLLRCAAVGPQRRRGGMAL